jgi:hypothetical protein
MQVGDIQDESQDESQDEAMPEDPGAELSGKYDFSAKRLEEYLLSAKPQDKIIKNLKEVILYPIWIIQFTFQSLYSLNSIICRN